MPPPYYCLPTFYFTCRVMFPFDYSSDFTVHAPGDQAAFPSTPPYLAILDLEMGVMLRPASYLGACILIVLIFSFILYHQAAYPRLPNFRGLIRDLDT